MPQSYSLDEVDALPLREAHKDTLHAPASHDSDIQARDLAIRNRRWEILQALLERGEGASTIHEGHENDLFDRMQRGRLIRLAVARTGVSEVTFYDLLRRYWRGGQVPNALLPTPRPRGREYVPPRDGSRPGRPAAGIRGLTNQAFDPELRAKAVKLYGKLVKRGTKPREAYDLATLEVYGMEQMIDGRMSKVRPKPASHIPGQVVLHYWLRKTTTRVELKKAHTPRDAWDRDNRARTGTAVSKGRGPGQVYEIDATEWPITLRSQRITSEDIGKATLYFVIDQYSQMIVGFHVTLDAENARGALMALASACMDKVAFMRSIGVAITEEDWPTHHVPTELVTDRGPAFTSDLMRMGAEALIVTPTHTPARKPYYKPFVENSFWKGQQSLLNRRVKLADGRLEVPRHSLNGNLTLPQLRKVIALEILKLNKTSQVRQVPAEYASADGTRPTPLELWNFGVQHHGVPTVRAAADVEKALLPRVTFTWTSNGLQLDGTPLRFTVRNRDDGIDLSRLKGRRAEKWKGMIHPDDLEHAFLFLGDGRPVPLTLAKGDGDRFENWTFGEAQEEKARGAANQADKRDTLDHEASSIRARQEHVVEDAMEEAGDVVATPSVVSKELRKQDDPARGAFRPKERRAATKAPDQVSHSAEISSQREVRRPSHGQDDIEDLIDDIMKDR